MLIQLQAHITTAEEVQDAQRILPFSIWFSTLFNGILGFSITIMIVFCMGNISNEALFETNFPFMSIFIEALGSKSGGLALVKLLRSCSLSLLTKDSQ